MLIFIEVVTEALIHKFRIHDRYLNQLVLLSDCIFPAVFPNRNGQNR